MNQLSEILLYIFCFFPFVKFIPISFGTDTQPWALCFSIILFFFIVVRNWKLVIPTIYLKILSVSVISGVLIYIFQDWLPYTELKNNSNLATFRSILSIISMLVVTYVAYFMFSNLKYNEKYIKKIINIYLFVGIIQKYIDKSFLNIVLVEGRTSANRGVVALTSEPSFYAYICVVLFFFVYDFKKNRTIYMLNVIIQIIFLAESTTGLVYLIILFLFLIIKKMTMINLKKVVYYITGGMAGTLAILYMLYYMSLKLSDKRIGMFLNIFFSERSLKSIWDNLMFDKSFTIRIYNITESIGAFLTDFGLPHGFNSIRISSGYGTLLYQYGIFGAFIVFCLFKIIRDNYKNNEMGRAFSYAVTVIMFSSIQLSSPVIWFYIGYCLSRQRYFSGTYTN